MRYLALGDSYTIGEGIALTGRWPVQLAGLLRESGATVDDPEIIAQTGWTTDELAAAIALHGPEGPYDLVSLLIGVNNQYRGLPLDAYAAGFADLLATATSLAGSDGSRVLVLSTPDWGATPFAAGRDRARIARAIDAFNAENRRIALTAGAGGYVDITGDSRSIDADLDLAPDGLHYSARAYRRWAVLALPAARAAIAQCRD